MKRLNQIMRKTFIVWLEHTPHQINKSNDLFYILDHWRSDTSKKLGNNNLFS